MRFLRGAWPTGALARACRRAWPPARADDLAGFRAVQLAFPAGPATVGWTPGKAGREGWRKSLAAKLETKHSCEICRTLGDVVRALEPEKYRCGSELEVAEAIRAALRKHAKRAGHAEKEASA